MNGHYILERKVKETKSGQRKTNFKNLPHHIL